MREDDRREREGEREREGAGVYISSEDTTMVSSGRETSIRAPGEVSPGHMMLAPLKINLMAPLSTCN